MRGRAALIRAVATAGVVAIAAGSPAFASSKQSPQPLPKQTAQKAKPKASQLLRRILGGIESIGAASGAPRNPRKPTVQEVSEGLTCQCGCGLTVANCNHPTCGFSVPTRAQIDGMIKSGMSSAQIIASFRHKFGEKVLSAPTTEGFNILAWVAPFAAILGGVILIMFVVGRWRSEAPTPGEAVASAPVDFDPRLKKILERELQERI